MTKTTIYLPEELKRDIHMLAQRRGVSEAEVMRTALEHETAELRPNWDALPVISSPELAEVARADEDYLRASGFGAR